MTGGRACATVALAGWPHNLALGKEDSLEPPDARIHAKVMAITQQRGGAPHSDRSLLNRRGQNASGYNFS